MKEEKFNYLLFSKFTSDEDKINYLNNVDIDVMIVVNGNYDYLLNYVLRTCSENVIRYLINLYDIQNLNFEITDLDCNTPLHIICETCSDELIKYMFEMYERKNLNLEIANKNGDTLLHIISQRCTYGLIKFMLDI